MFIQATLMTKQDRLSYKIRKAGVSPKKNHKNSGGKTIVPFLKNHYYLHPEKIPEEEPCYVFDQQTDMELLQLANRSWKSPGQL